MGWANHGSLGKGKSIDDNIIDPIREAFEKDVIRLQKEKMQEEILKEFANKIGKQEDMTSVMHKAADKLFKEEMKK